MSWAPAACICERGTTTSNPTSAASLRDCVAVERKRANPLQLAARAHRVDERDAVDRIAADVDDEQFSALLACVSRVGLAGT
jgi:hypothetical protein